MFSPGTLQNLLIGNENKHKPKRQSKMNQRRNVALGCHAWVQLRQRMDTEVLNHRIKEESKAVCGPVYLKKLISDGCFQQLQQCSLSLPGGQICLLYFPSKSLLHWTQCIIYLLVCIHLQSIRSGEQRPYIYISYYYCISSSQTSACPMETAK